MNAYTPDKWLIIKITNGDTKLYRLFGSWYGGYAGADEWRMNSGIVKMEDKGAYYDVHGHSGSVYEAGKFNYGASAYAWGVLKQLMDRSKEQGTTIEVMPEDTKWEAIL